jgi:ring-1,2-phenylacetyl-CoA epoxidase subunit PaaD
VVTTQTATELREVLAQVMDPEIPVLTIEDLGVLRDVHLDGGRVVVTITPTYSGCPAMDEIRADIRTALRAAGHDDVEVRTVLAPAWTTDWMTESGRRALREAGIAPPAPRDGGPVLVPLGRRHVVALPAVRLGRHRGAHPLRLDLLQGDVALPHVPRALRPLPGALMGGHRR